MMVMAPHATSPGLDKPRVISEIRKKARKTTHSQESQPRISGSLEWGADGDTPWQARHVEVRDGSLVMLTSPSGCPELRIPLRHLNLQPGSRPRAFCLSRDQALPVATFQANSELEYERWVKTLAIELLRQTPLEAVRFLDILGITSTLSQDDRRPLRRGASEDNLSTLGRDVREGRLRRKRFEVRRNNHVTSKTIVEARINRENLGDGKLRRGNYFIVNNLSTGDKATNVMVKCKVLEKKQNTEMNGRNLTVVLGSDSELDHIDTDFSELLSKCQQVDKYVSVREKRRLFESLCRGRRLAQSSDDLHIKVSGDLRSSKRAQSLHDLSELRCCVAVREICRYFEQRSRAAQDVGGGNPERRLERIKQETVEVEEELWRIQEEMAVLDGVRSQKNGRQDRSSVVKLYTALEHRLAQEELRLARLQSEAGRALKLVQQPSDKFESALVQTNENTGRQ